MSTNAELAALAGELMETRRLSLAEAMVEARRALSELQQAAWAWDHEAEVAQADLRQYALAWDYQAETAQARQTSGSRRRW